MSSNNKKKEIPENIRIHLQTIVDHFQKEDRSVRDRQIRNWRKLKLYWEGFQHVYFNEEANDYRVAGQITTNNNGDSNGDNGAPGYYDRPINVFRAYLESLVAALSIAIPAVTCIPDDADNMLDVATAKAGDKIGELVYKHNDVVILWLYALFIYCTEGMLAAYSYTAESKEYGEVEVPNYATSEEEHYICPECHDAIEDDFVENYKLESQQNIVENPPIIDSGLGEGLDDNAQPSPLSDNGLDDIGNRPQADPFICPSCGSPIDVSLLNKETVEIERLEGTTTAPKSRQCIKVYGGLFVKVPNYAKNQAECPYLILSEDVHYSKVICEFPELYDKFPGEATNVSGGYDLYERWGRLNPQYLGEWPENNVTVRYIWLRPFSYHVLAEENVKDLTKRFPDGVKITFVNEHLADAVPENMDDHWTLSHNPMSDYLTHEPIGNFLVAVQDITNDIVSMTLQTIDQGVTQTFADPSVFDFKSYNQLEATVGGVFPLKVGATQNRSIQEFFHTIKTASLSPEVLPFGQKMQEMGQLVSGAMPSLFGGMNTGGSKTASEYSMSRAQALQRLQTPWKMLTIWWKQIFNKVIPAYIKTVQEDEKFVKKDTSGNFVNVLIRKADLEGKIGSVELEASEQLPITTSQKKDVIMELIQLNNPEILQALFSPENLPIVKDIVGIADFSIPGLVDRDKQYEEIQQLVESTPIDDGMGGMQPSVMIDQLLDNHQIEAEICRDWLVGERGRLAKIDNQAGYQNVLLHMKMHMMAAMQSMQMNQAPPTEEGGNDSKQSSSSPKDANANSNGEITPVGAE